MQRIHNSKPKQNLHDSKISDVFIQPKKYQNYLKISVCLENSFIKNCLKVSLRHFSNLQQHNKNCFIKNL